MDVSRFPLSLAPSRHPSQTNRENTLMPWDKGLHSCVCDLPTKEPVCAGWMCTSLSVGRISSNLIRKDKTERPKRKVEVVILSWSTNIVESIEQEEFDCFFPAPLLYITQTQTWGEQSMKDEHQDGSIPCVGALSLSPKSIWMHMVVAGSAIFLVIPYLSDLTQAHPLVFDLHGWMWIWKSSSMLSAASCSAQGVPEQAALCLTPAGFLCRHFSVFSDCPLKLNSGSALSGSLGGGKMNMRFSKIVHLKIPGLF